MPNLLPSSRASSPYRASGVALIVLLAGTLLLARSGRIDLAAQDFFLTRLLPPESPISDAERDTLQPPAPPPLTPSELPAHPDVVHREYLNPSLLESDVDSSSLVFQFRELLALYEKRQGVDDNFTLRVFDSRTGELLELYTMEEERAAYQRGEPVDWQEIDEERRRLTRKLVEKYEARGIPKEAIGVRWGRANQV